MLGPGGVSRPRVTSVIKAAGLSPDYTGIPPEVVEAAGRRGTTVHSLIEQHHTAGGRQPMVLGEAAPYFAAYLRFLAESGYESKHAEVVVEHPTWGYIGHVDSVGWLKVERALIDWKCVASLDEDAVAIQLAAYRMAWQAQHPAEPIQVCAGVQLRPDATYRFCRVDVDKAEPIWLAALTLYHARVRMGRLGPWLVP